jgi:hypothetical protein
MEGQITRDSKHLIIFITKNKSNGQEEITPGPTAPVCLQYAAKSCLSTDMYQRDVGAGRMHDRENSVAVVV